MKNTAILSVSALALSLASAPVFAQALRADTDLTGVASINEKIDNVNEAVADDFARSSDRDRFGPADAREGLSGGISLTYAGRTGSKDTQDFTLAGRMSHTQGRLTQNVGLVLEYGESESVKDKEETFVVYDANYLFNDRFYGFMMGRIKTDSLASGTDLRRDGFLGFGPGYRVINTPDTTWRVQAGVGVSYTKGATSQSETEAGYIASSRFYHRFNDTLFVTNDTDFLTSDMGGDRINNELGLNVKMSDAFATRVSYITDYQENRSTKTDNKLGVSLVYGF